MDEIYPTDPIYLTDPIHSIPVHVFNGSLLRKISPPPKVVSPERETFYYKHDHLPITRSPLSQQEDIDLPEEHN